jgi:hypothetical protein
MDQPDLLAATLKAQNATADRSPALYLPPSQTAGPLFVPRRSHRLAHCLLKTLAERRLGRQQHYSLRLDPAILTPHSIEFDHYRRAVFEAR